MPWSRRCEASQTSWAHQRRRLGIGRAQFPPDVGAPGLAAEEDDLASELVTNSVQHSNSRCPGGTVTISVLAVPDGVVIEVIDDGGATIPALAPTQPGLIEGGRGLRLVDMLATRWSHHRDTAGTVTWFELTREPHQ